MSGGLPRFLKEELEAAEVQLGCGGGRAVADGSHRTGERQVRRKHVPGRIFSGQPSVREEVTAARERRTAPPPSLQGATPALRHYYATYESAPAASRRDFVPRSDS